MPLSWLEIADNVVRGLGVMIKFTLTGYSIIFVFITSKEYLRRNRYIDD
jgi:hypothetical protein